MAILERDTLVPALRSDVFAFFSDPRNLARITPSSLGFEIVDAPARKLRRGDRIRYRIRLLGFRIPWTTHITKWIDGLSFIDEQERGPYKRWRHEHVLEDAPGGTMMRDRVEYSLPLGFLGTIVAGWWVRRNLRTIFDYRQRAIREMFPPSRNETARLEAAR